MNNKFYVYAEILLCSVFGQFWGIEMSSFGTVIGDSYVQFWDSHRGLVFTVYNNNNEAFNFVERLFCALSA